MDKMTSTATTSHLSGRQAELERARKRAHGKGLEIVGKCTTKRGDYPIYAVTSATEANRLHLVVVIGSRLQCDCTGARYGGYCAHRALVRDFLAAEAERRRQDRDTAPLRRPSAQAPFSLLKR